LALAGCASSQPKPADSTSSVCVSPLPDLIKNQLRVFKGNYPERFSVYNFIIPKDLSTRESMNDFVILSILTFTQKTTDLPIQHVRGIALEKKSFYEYPSIFEFPIIKNNYFVDQKNAKHEYLEQDVHIVLPMEHLKQKESFELVLKEKNGKIPLFESPVEIHLPDVLKTKWDETRKPDMVLAAKLVFETYCLLNDSLQ